MSEPTTQPASLNLTTTTSTPTTTVSTTTTTTTEAVTTTKQTPSTYPPSTTVPQPSTTTKKIIQTTTVPRIPSTTQLKQCPKLVIPHASMSTDSRDAGTLVRLRCDEHSAIDGPAVILCQESGFWNSSLPTCRGDETAVPLSTKLFIGILTGCCALVLLVVVAILIKLWMCGKGGQKSRSRYSDRHHRLPRTSVDTLPSVPNAMHHYPPQDRRYNVYQGTLSKASDTNSTIYAKPEIYSTFINPGFYEDVYDRWRRRGSEEIYAAGSIYDSPWQHRGAAGTDGEGSGEQPSERERPDMRWSSVSLRAHDNYDYGRFGKIPRSQVCETESTDTNL